jgi:hypothetical protein
MKPLKKKMTSTEWARNIESRVNYKKFLKKTVLERRKQININGDK